MVRTAVDQTTRLEMYRMMVEARLFERRVHDLFLQGLVKGTSHLALGQEAVAAGFAAALRPSASYLIQLLSRRVRPLPAVSRRATRVLLGTHDQ